MLGIFSWKAITVTMNLFCCKKGNFLKNPEFPYEYNERFGLDAMDDTIQFIINLNSGSNMNFAVLEKEK